MMTGEADRFDYEAYRLKSYDKARRLIEAGCTFSTFSTFSALSNLCGFVWHEPVISMGMMLIGPNDKAAADRFYTEAKSHAHRLAEAVR